MDRFTGRIGDKYVYIEGRSTLYPTDSKKQLVSKAIARLAAYEDTGLSPEEITAMCDQRDADKSKSPAVAEMLSPFSNDPFSIVWKAFNNLYPGRSCTCFWDPQIRDTEDGTDVYGLTDFDENTGEYMVFVKPDTLTVNNSVEIFAHELAHVAAGVDKEHGPEWEDAFDAIFKEYNRIGDEMFPPLFETGGAV